MIFAQSHAFSKGVDRSALGRFSRNIGLRKFAPEFDGVSVRVLLLNLPEFGLDKTQKSVVIFKGRDQSAIAPAVPK